MIELLIIVPKNYCHICVSCLFTILEHPALIALPDYRYQVISDVKALNPIVTNGKLNRFKALKPNIKWLGRVIIIPDIHFNSNKRDDNATDMIQYLDRSNNLILAMGQAIKLFPHQKPLIHRNSSPLLNSNIKQKFTNIKLGIPADQNHFYCQHDVLTTQRGFAYFQAMTFILIHLYGAKLAAELSFSLQYQLPNFLSTKTTTKDLENRFSETLQWMQNNIASIKNIDTMANKACMSRRSFDRKFKQVFSHSPKQWLLKERLRLAKHHLIHSQLNLDEIAERSGFMTACKLRKHFGQLCGKTPSQFRKDQLLIRSETTT